MLSALGKYQSVNERTHTGQKNKIQYASGSPEVLMN